VSWYSAGLPGSAAFRASVNKMDSACTVIEALEAFYDAHIASGVIRDREGHDLNRKDEMQDDPDAATGDSRMEAA